MKKMTALFALAAMLALASAVPGAPAEEHHIKADLVASDGSGSKGFVQLTQLPKGGANVVVVAHGLQPGTVYASFYYESGDRTAPADLLASFTADSDGNGTVQGKIDDDLDEVGSVSVRLGPDYGTLIACAATH